MSHFGLFNETALTWDHKIEKADNGWCNSALDLRADHYPGCPPEKLQ